MRTKIISGVGGGITVDIFEELGWTGFAGYDADACESDSKHDDLSAIG